MTKPAREVDYYRGGLDPIDTIQKTEMMIIVPFITVVAIIVAVAVSFIFDALVSLGGAVAGVLKTLQPDVFGPVYTDWFWKYGFWIGCVIFAVLLVTIGFMIWLITRPEPGDASARYR